MGTISGERSVEIDAPVERCYEIASDINHAPEWQGSLKDVEVLERDGESAATWRQLIDWCVDGVMTARPVAFEQVLRAHPAPETCG